jgi:hypothetical protein
MSNLGAARGPRVGECEFYSTDDWAWQLEWEFQAFRLGGY